MKMQASRTSLFYVSKFDTQQFHLAIVGEEIVYSTFCGEKIIWPFIGNYGWIYADEGFWIITCPHCRRIVPLLMSDGE